MPVFNDEKYLEESINTVINQTLKDIELICVNDGSTDNSIDILCNLKKKHDFIKIYSQYNQGSGKARNNGIEKATGEYIAFLDSDDRFIENNALEKMYECGIKYDAEMVSANLKGITIKNELVNNNDGVERFVKENIILGKEYGIPYAFYKNIFKTSFLNKHNLRFPDLRRGQDPVFLSEIISKVEKIPVLPIDLYGFRYAATGGLSKINTFEKKWDYIKHFRETFNILQNAGFIEILEKYKEKLFLFINHAENSSDEIVYNIFQEIFRDDATILNECEKYFNINSNTGEDLNLKIKNLETEINNLKSNNQELNQKNRNILNEKQAIELRLSTSPNLEEFNNIKSKAHELNKKNNLLIEENENLYNETQIIDKYKFNNIKLIDENNYLLNENNFLRIKIKNLYEINEKILSNTNNTSEDFIKLNKNQFEYFNKEYSSLTKRYEKINSVLNNTIYDNLKELSIKQQSNQINLTRIKKNINLLEDNNLLKKELQNLKIAYVLYGFPTLSETFILNELRWLRENNCNVKVFSYMDPRKPVNLDFDIEVYRFDNGGDLIENLEKLLIEHEIDLMHTHFVFPTGTKYTFPVSKKLKIPFTIFAHAFDIFVKDIAAVNNIQEMTNSEYCKGIFTLSNYHKNYLIEKGVPEEKIILTRQASEYEVCPLIKKQDPIKNIVSISRFVEKKGLDVLIKAADLLKDEDIEFSIYGFGELENELKEQITELKLENISIKGSLNGPNEVKSVLMNSDLLVSPCKVAENGDQDGIPTVLFESMGYGVPVLTTSVSAIPEFIENEKNGFIVKPNDPIELSNEIRFIMKMSSEDLFEIRKNAQWDVQEISSIDETMNNILTRWSEIKY